MVFLLLVEERNGHEFLKAMSIQCSPMSHETSFSSVNNLLKRGTVRKLGGWILQIERNFTNKIIHKFFAKIFFLILDDLNIYK